MQIAQKKAALSAALALLAASGALAQGNPQIDDLRKEVDKLKGEISELRKARDASSTGARTSDRLDQVELRQKDAVTGGDIGGSFRLPGSETSLRVYGFAEAHLIKDLRATASGDDFTNLMEQPSGSTDPKGKAKITAQTSRFGFETSTPTDVGSLTTKVEGDFYAYCGSECNRNLLRIRHAYGEYNGFLIGQTWSTFMDLDNLPETVDFNGPIGAPFSRRAMVRYTYNNPQGSKFTVALEDPENGARWPNLVARWDKSFDWGGLNVRLLSHEKRYGQLSKRGAGVGIGGSFKLTGSDLLMAQFARVNGDYAMMYGSTGYAVDTVNNKIVFDKNNGLVVGWAHTFSDKLRSNVVLGVNQSKADAIYVAESINYYGVEQAKRLTQLHVGAIYTPVKNVELGVDYIYGQRKFFSVAEGGSGSENGKMSRLDLMARYSF